MPITRLLMANRGEIAIRIARAVADMGLRSVAAHSRDDTRSLHLRAADEVLELPGQGVAVYLDADAFIAAAKASGCDAVHLGYGFLVERAEFARHCAKAICGRRRSITPPLLRRIIWKKSQARSNAIPSCLSNMAFLSLIHRMPSGDSLTKPRTIAAKGATRKI